MNLAPYQCKNSIIEESKRLGIAKIGFAVANPVDNDNQNIYSRWIQNGKHGEMEYLSRYNDVRNDPRLLLPSTGTIISCAINYYPQQKQSPSVPQIASYALGQDYHEVVRVRLSALATFIKTLWGGETRVCVDTAPLRERYWAVKSGLGFIGINNQLIIPGRGSYFFLGEILTTLQIPEDEPCTLKCTQCGACIKACPNKAISPDGSIDATRCLSYLTIEHRGELPEDIFLGNRVYGCDTCQEVCPHNRNAQPTNVEEFSPSPELLHLDRKAMEEMTQEQFSAIFRHSAVKRTKYAGLMRNLKKI